MDSELQVARCNPATEKQALEIAGRAWPATERLAYGQAVESLIGNGLADRVVLIAALQQNRVHAAQLGLMLAGKAALVWPPQFDAETNTSDCRLFAAALAEHMAEALKQGGMHIAQSLLARDETDNSQWLEIGGFSHAADLLYLTADVDRVSPDPPQLPFELESLTPTAEQRLAEVVQRTYVGTLDCPQLDGLRDTADVIEGYKNVGEFRPEFWFFVRYRAEDVGCLLMNLHPDVQHAEIVYLAVTPEVRGRGWGLELAKYALWLARQAKSLRAVLAVDAANEPALRMYVVAGFDVFDRREVWLRTFPR
jgi:ribosomal protein S18 acetylase RimI-like enzyme